MLVQIELQIKVEDFFSFYFSDDAVDFVSSYHEKCGDKGRAKDECNVEIFFELF